MPKNVYTLLFVEISTVRRNANTTEPALFLVTTEAAGKKTVASVAESSFDVHKYRQGNSRGVTAV